MSERELPSGVERHLQTGLMAIGIALMLWLGKTTNDNAQELAVMNIKFQVVSSQLETISSASKASGGKYYDLDRRITEYSNRMERAIEQFRNHQNNNEIHVKAP